MAEGNTRRTGTIMLVLAWVAGMALAVQWFSGVEERQLNPNLDPQSRVTAEAVEVRLERNRHGHYIAGGRINGRNVTFLLDTGATFVALPASLASDLGLSRGRPIMVQTANGTTKSYSTLLDSLELGDIRLHDVRAGIVPGMGGDEVLLGMSALQQLDFSQQGNELILRHYR
ncbi:retropepsin-like aspartic protease family protein [Halopseudomonas salegens]|uniref:Aspartyl protease family protein n=1 Tax=Halopseudomonas salegens TaxID=1434072 RepID=A0A1H2EN71_9GAMM|nr:TIGR02281 family clan AA aspartic protease [Halopseudomonas salegens]SDT96560.1 aspartyl protease family protein [Halopseudomonas salegens]